MSIEFVFARDDPDTFASGWQAYTTGDPALAWPYTGQFLRYMRTYTRTMVEDLSFVCRQGGRWAGVAPLFLEKDADGRLQFSYSGDFGRAPLCGGSPDIEKEIFARIDELALEKKASRSMMMVEPVTWVSGEQKYNRLQRYGYFEASVSSNLIDLDQSEERIFQRMRHGHESLIRRRQGDYEVHAMDHTNPDFGLYEQYRLLHHKDAGRVTRPLETFRQQFEMIEKDNAALIGLRHHGDWVAFAYFYQGARSAYYGSGAQDPDFAQNVKNSGLFHCLLMEGIRYYRKRGFAWLETGWQPFGPQPWDRPSDKEIAIAHFKRGFGGINVPLFRGVKYYDPEALEKDMRQFVDRQGATLRALHDRKNGKVE